MLTPGTILYWTPATNPELSDNAFQDTRLIKYVPARHACAAIGNIYFKMGVTGDHKDKYLGSMSTDTELLKLTDEEYNEVILHLLAGTTYFTWRRWSNVD